MKNEEEEKNLEEVLNFNTPDFVFTPSERHGWRQEGPYLVCKTCELQHASYIGMDKVLIGLDEEGQPILRDRS